MQFIRKSALAEAFKMTEEARDDNSAWPTWLNEAWQKDSAEVGAVYPAASAEMRNVVLRLFDIERVVPFGDYIVRSDRGALFVVAADTFEKDFAPLGD
jgi:hypothetical protein